MAVASSDAPRDTLARLRIQRASGPPRRSFFGRLIRYGILLCLLLGVGFGFYFVGQNRGWLPEMSKMLESVRPRPEVRVALVSAEKGRSADALVVATGYLQSRQQARIGARATGRIQEINVEEGSRVKAHDVLAVLEHADLDASLAAAKATAARSKSELLEHAVEIAKVQRDFQRAEQLVARKSMNPADFDQALYLRDAALAKNVSLEAALQLADARVQEAEQMRENMFVRAPFQGTVISKDAELGESIMPGGMGEASGRGSVVTIADLEHLEVDCDVKEDYISRVTEQQLTEVAVDAVPDCRYKGRVRKIIPMGDRARATVKVRVEILNADERLFPEMSSTVYFLPNESEGSTKQGETRTFCPTDAIVKSESETWVWLVTD
ncbi:MAG TPA: efflux RND transporter periplasmic adaptor subunit, partial [Planctomycetaceae bacterium]|nr:efflux RND transporter periplasmic adaptor subunit [Planctomycetaceae bacterium]